MGEQIHRGGGGGKLELWRNGGYGCAKLKRRMDTGGGVESKWSAHGASCVDWAKKVLMCFIFKKFITNRLLSKHLFI